MTNPADSSVQNLLPVQAYFNADGSFNTFIGQGQPFYATANPSQSGLNITSSTINSTTIGATTPSSGVFTSIATTTGTITTAPSGATDIANKQYVDFYAAGLSWKQPALTGTSANITLSGLQTINGVTVVAGDVVLVKNQTNAAQNGIYVASAGAWTYSAGGDTWSEYVGAIIFITNGSLAGTAWYCTAQPGGTLGTTAMNWSNFSVASSYTAGTGLTLTGTQFSITNTGLAAATYGSASSIPVIAFNAQGQATSVTNTTVTPAVGSITGLGTGVATWLATPSSANLASAVTDETGSGSLVFATSPTLVTPILGTPTSGNFSTGTFTWPTFNQNTTGTAAKATNLAGGAVGNVPYQSAADTTTFLATGTNGQVLTLASGVPSWATPTTGTVTSVSGTAPIVSSGGNTPAISIPVATSSANGYLSSTDWTTFNNKSNTNGTVTSVAGAGTVNGLTLTGTVTTSGSLTLGGTLDLSSPPAIGGTTPLAGTFTDLRFNNTLSLAGSTGTAGYVVTSNGASAPTWQALPASGITITDDTTTNATRYLAFTSATSGSITGQNVSSTKLQYNPLTGALILANDASISGLTVGKGAGTSTQSTSVGASALSGANTVGYNTAFGYFALKSNTDGANNVSLGNQALQNNTTASQNTAVGSFALTTNTTGANNSALGQNALQGNTTGGNNVAFGVSALSANTTASNNTAVGYQSLYTNTTGNQIVAIGKGAGYSNTTGTDSVFVGYHAGYTNTGAGHVAVGSTALTSNTTGNFNTSVGYVALANNTTGSNNTAHGMQSLRSSTTADNNTAVGYNASYSNTTGASNTTVGYNALYSGTTAASAVAIGVSSANALTTGSNGIYIGAASTASSGSVNSEIVIATNGPSGKGANTGLINPNGGGVYQGNNSATWSVTSDARLKKNIVDNNTGLDAINKIQVRNFEYRLPEEITEIPQDQAIAKTGIQLGAIAQELELVLPECVKQESTGIYTVDADPLIWYLVNAVKELKSEIDLLKATK